MPKTIARVARLAQQITETTSCLIVGWEASETYVQFCCECGDLEYVLKVTAEDDDENIVKIECDEYPFDQVYKYMTLDINDALMIEQMRKRCIYINIDLQDYTF